MGNHAGDDEDAHGSAHDEHANHAADEGGNKAENNGGGGIREEHGAVDGGNGAGDELVRDALEGRHEVGKNHADAVVDDGDADGEGERAGQCVDDEVIATGELVNHSRIGNPSDNAREQVEERHGQTGGDGGVTQEGKALGNLNLLGAVLLSILLEDAAHGSGDVVREGAKVTHSDLVAIGDLLGEVLANGRKHGAHEAEEQATGDDQGNVRETRGLKHGGEQAGHEEAVVTGEEDVLKLGEAGNQDVDHVAKNQDDHGLDAKNRLRHGDDDLVVGDNALDVEAGLDEGAERGKVGLNEAGARRKHEVAKDGLEGTGHDLVGGTLECNKAHKRE